MTVNLPICQFANFASVNQKLSHHRTVHVDVDKLCASNERCVFDSLLLVIRDCFGLGLGRRRRRRRRRSLIAVTTVSLWLHTSHFLRSCIHMTACSLLVATLHQAT